jgi:hypothetical protein
VQELNESRRRKFYHQVRKYRYSTAKEIDPIGVAAFEAKAEGERQLGNAKRQTTNLDRSI